MTKIYNSDTIKEVRDAAKIQISTDATPQETSDKVVYTMEVNPKLLRTNNVFKASNNSSSGSSTIYTTPTDRDFFLTEVYFSFIKDATCDVATAANLGIQATNGFLGASITLVQFPCLTLTAQSDSGQVVFKNPVKIDRGTSIQIMNAAFTVGSMVRVGGIRGYTVENTGA